MKKQPIKKRKPAQQKITELDMMEARIQFLEDEVIQLKKYMLNYESKLHERTRNCTSTDVHSADTLRYLLNMDIDKMIANDIRIPKVHEKIKREDMDTSMEINDYNSLMAGSTKGASTNIGPEQLYDMFMKILTDNKVDNGIAIEGTGLVMKILKNSINMEIKDCERRRNDLDNSLERASI